MPNGNVVAVAFTGGSNGQGCGVVSYQVLADGTLDGSWGYWGVNEMGTERATRTSGSGLAGDYNVAGTNPNGSGYKADLSITPESWRLPVCLEQQHIGFRDQTRKYRFGRNRRFTLRFRGL